MLQRLNRAVIFPHQSFIWPSRQAICSRSCIIARHMLTTGEAYRSIDPILNEDQSMDNHDEQYHSKERLDQYGLSKEFQVVQLVTTLSFDKSLMQKLETDSRKKKSTKQETRKKFYNERQRSQFMKNNRRNANDLIFKKLRNIPLAPSNAMKIHSFVPPIPSPATRSAIETYAERLAFNFYEAGTFNTIQQIVKQIILQDKSKRFIKNTYILNALLWITSTDSEMMNFIINERLSEQVNLDAESLNIVLYSGLFNLYLDQNGKLNHLIRWLTEAKLKFIKIDDVTLELAFSTLKFSQSKSILIDFIKKKKIRSIEPILRDVTLNDLVREIKIRPAYWLSQFTIKDEASTKIAVEVGLRLQPKLTWSFLDNKVSHMEFNDDLFDTVYDHFAMNNKYVEMVALLKFSQEKLDRRGTEHKLGELAQFCINSLTQDKVFDEFYFSIVKMPFVFKLMNSNAKLSKKMKKRISEQISVTDEMSFTEREANIVKTIEEAQTFSELFNYDSTFYRLLKDLY